MTAYQAALAAAIDAARAAGARLRAELHHEGGPRGEGSHAPIDEEVEADLRAALCAAAPWGWCGEETGVFDPPGADPSHRWVVDPNDGTASFLLGLRGASVAIGALRDGEPILGVVYAWAWPDDDGDLFAWAEGCGPLTRNGRTVTNDLSTAGLGPRAHVIVSQHADRAPEANARCVAPARYRPMPSIALRLALVAAGEGVAAVSLASPASWDVAAGHALVRAVGGVLRDQSGAEVRYDAQGNTSTAVVVGGAPAAVDALLARPWHEVYDPAVQREPFLRLGAPAEHVADPGRLSRAQGCWLGQLTGDALGAQVEFRGVATIAQRYPGGLRELRDGGTWDTLAGQPTDDSEMALALARTLVSVGPDLDAVLDAYVGWIRSGPFDCGGTVAAALRGAIRAEAGERRVDAARAAARVESEANGSLMRVSPWAIWFAGRPSEAARWASDDSALTHPNPACRDACAVFCAAIAAAVGDGLDARATYEVALREAEGRDEMVGACLRNAETSRPASYEHNQGWVRIALQNAFFQLLNAPSFEEALVDTVMRGGDTDTNAAIAGALVGAVRGRDAVPQRWRVAVQGCRPMEEAGATRPRPMRYWPCDALELAEALLWKGRG